jgi:quercetin dioxygenase-like cupin family protein
MSTTAVAPTPYLKLPLSFDLARLQEDLQRVASAQWINHFNTSAYEKGWGCIPLRSVDGRVDHIMPVEGGHFEDTPLLARCPYFRHAIEQFRCEKTSIRLMGLEAGGVIHEHRDDGGALEDGLTRLHIPVQTSPQALFRIDGEEVHFSAGDAWYLNASCLHGAHNRGAQARIHLMIDCVTNPWLTQLFLAAGGVLREDPPYGDASLNDDNVQQAIARLLDNGHAVGAQLAARLQEIHARRTGTAARP